MHSDPNITDVSRDSIVGRWSYRSLRNLADLARPFSELEFGRGLITLGRLRNDALSGSTLDMGSGYELTLSGAVSRAPDGATAIRLRGLGLAGTATAGWVYDYNGWLVPTWPQGQAQAPAIVGSVIRSVAHGESPEGVVASFYMVKQESES